MDTESTSAAKPPLAYSDLHCTIGGGAAGSSIHSHTGEQIVRMPGKLFV